MVREEKVRELVAAANAAMLPGAEDASSGEVLSAYFTLAAMAVSAAQSLGADPTALQQAAYELWLRCYDDDIAKWVM